MQSWLYNLERTCSELEIHLDQSCFHMQWMTSDTIQERSNSDFDVRSASIQFYDNNHNSQSDCWIRLNFYVESPDMVYYLGLKFQVNQSLGRYRNMGQRRLYEFCYLLSFDLWTSNLVRILFLKGYMAAYFGNLLILQRSLMGCNIGSKCGKDS